MSANHLLLASIRTRATSDTGAGGLFQVGGVNAVTGWFSLDAAQGQSLPFVVVFILGTTRVNHFDSAVYADEVAMQFSIYCDNASDYSVEQGIEDRILTRFDRWAPTVTGFTASQLIHDGTTIIQQDNGIRHHAMDFRCVLSK